MSPINPIVAEIPSGEITTADFKRLERKIDRVLAEFNQLASNRAVVTTMNRKQARAYVNCTSESQFDRWIQNYAPFARARKGRYSRARLDIGRARELSGVTPVQTEDTAK